MNDILKMAAVAVAGALCCVVVRKQTPELALALALAAGGVVLWMAFSSLEYVTSFLRDLAQQAGLTPAVLSPVLKVVGISVVTHTSAAFCKDAKESGLAAFLELGGTVAALVVIIPLMKAVLDTVRSLI